jgi:hypothetical protein
MTVTSSFALRLPSSIKAAVVKVSKQDGDSRRNPEVPCTLVQLQLIPACVDTKSPPQRTHSPGDSLWN